jgi:predicted RNA binding protein YcfA (HicA-like mRNA interferase family)
VTGREVLVVLLARGCVVVRQRGSHVLVRCGSCQAPVPLHAGHTLGRGLLRTIERQFEPCLGARWLRP